MPSVTRTIAPDKRRRAIIAGTLGGLAVIVIISLQVIITLTKSAPLAPPSSPAVETGVHLNGLESLKESVSGLKNATQAAWEVAQEEVQNQ